MASSPNSSVFGSVQSNPFTEPTSDPNPIAAAAIQHVNIHSHVPITLTLDFAENNFSMWSAFFDATFRKFDIVDHIDGSTKA
jgi:hypothetical protein